MLTPCWRAKAYPLLKGQKIRLSWLWSSSCRVALARVWYKAHPLLKGQTLPFIERPEAPLIVVVVLELLGGLGQGLVGRVLWQQVGELFADVQPAKWHKQFLINLQFSSCFMSDRRKCFRYVSCQINWNISMYINFLSI